MKNTEELTVRNDNLPATLEGCVDFMVVSEEKLNALKAAIRAAKKTDMPAEALKQLTTQAQQIGEAVIQTKIKIGELTSEMEKDKGGRPTKNSCEPRTSLKKEDQLHDLGLSRFRAAECERLARHKDAVIADVQRTKERGEVPSTRQALEVAKAEEDATKRIEVFKASEARVRHSAFQDNATPTIEAVKQETEDMKSIRFQLEKSTDNAASRLTAIRMDFEHYKAIVNTSSASDKARWIDGLSKAAHEAQKIIEMIRS